MSRLGQKYEIAMVATSKSREEYNSEAYVRVKLPEAPAIRIDDETTVERADISEEKLEEIIKNKLGLGAVTA